MPHPPTSANTTNSFHSPARPRRLWLHIVLLLVTFATMTGTGALYNITEEQLMSAALAPWLEGLWYSVPLLVILMAHEMGHYFAALRHRVPVTLPYFIPGIMPFGTFGAFIRMRPTRMTPRALLEIGAAGPLAGLVFAVPFLYIGLSLSEIKPLPEDIESVMQMGDSIVGYLGVKLFFDTIPADSDVFLHPMAYAGWVGIFVTAFNLIPIGQLDGGHICYALFGPQHNRAAVFLYGCLLVTGIAVHPGWLVLAVLLLVIGIKHPPITTDEPLPRFQRIIGYVSIAVFFLTFIPQPIKVATLIECIVNR